MVKTVLRYFDDVKSTVVVFTDTLTKVGFVLSYIFSIFIQFIVITFCIFIQFIVTIFYTNTCLYYISEMFLFQTFTCCRDLVYVTRQVCC